jgi:hypothetical protein
LRIFVTRLFARSSRKMSPKVRLALEARIVAGEAVTAAEVRRARG